MTESEYNEQKERLEEYRSAQNKVSSIAAMKLKINVGIREIQCDHGNKINLALYDEDFCNRLKDNIVSFLDKEIECIKKSMEDI